jgi:hypothetical protein
MGETNEENLLDEFTSQQGSTGSMTTWVPMNQCQQDRSVT